MPEYCIQEECETRASYGLPGEEKKYKRYCQTHAPNGFVDVSSKKCLYEDCNKQRSYGVLGGTVKNAEFCQKHAPENYVNVRKRTCIVSECRTTALFGPKGGTRRDAIHCGKHAPEGYVNLSKKICIFKDCELTASFADPKLMKMMPIYCSNHAPKGYINTKQKICYKENCDTQASFGKVGGKYKDIEYCSKHAPQNYIDLIRNRYCQFKKCNTTASYGIKGINKIEYCSKHAPNGYVNLISRECLFKNCDTRASYGIKESEKKVIKYCLKHAPEGYVNLTKKICIEKDCSTQASFGELFKTKIHCSKHKKNNEYKNYIPKCEYLNCDEKPYYALQGNYPLRCEDHQIDGDKNIIERKCKNCGLMFMLNPENLCNDCNNWINEKITERKEITIKKIIEENYQTKYISHDSIPNGSCLRYRPDFIWDHGTHIVILEIDENQHKSYACECEQSRMINITQDFGGAPVLWVRFNPDAYEDCIGNKFRNNIRNRMALLIETLKKAEIYYPKALCSTIYLFYDGFDSNKLDIEEINLSILGL